MKTKVIENHIVVNTHIEKKTREFIHHLKSLVDNDYRECLYKPNSYSIPYGGKVYKKVEICANSYFNHNKELNSKFLNLEFKTSRPHYDTTMTVEFIYRFNDCGRDKFIIKIIDGDNILSMNDTDSLHFTNEGNIGKGDINLTFRLLRSIINNPDIIEYFEEEDEYVDVDSLIDDLEKEDSNDALSIDDIEEEDTIEDKIVSGVLNKLQDNLRFLDSLFEDEAVHLPIKYNDENIHLSFSASRKGLSELSMISGKRFVLVEYDYSTEEFIIRSYDKEAVCILDLSYPDDSITYIHDTFDFAEIIWISEVIDKLSKQALFNQISKYKDKFIDAIVNVMDEVGIKNPLTRAFVKDLFNNLKDGE